jgi:hypothetical protein
MAATGSGYLIPRPPLVAPNATVVAVAATASLVLATHYDKNLTNTGSAATAVLTLIPAKDAAGRCVHFYQTVAQITRLLPTTGEAICFHGNVVVTKYLNIPATIGSWVELYCDGERYHVVNSSGIITKEA